MRCGPGGDMVKVTSTEFCRNFGRFQDMAQREPVAVSSHGRTTAYLISAESYERFEAIRESMRRHLRVGALPESVVAAIKAARVDPAHGDLDKLLDD